MFVSRVSQECLQAYQDLCYHQLSQQVCTKLCEEVPKIKY